MPSKVRVSPVLEFVAVTVQPPSTAAVGVICSRHDIEASCWLTPARHTTAVTPATSTERDRGRERDATRGSMGGRAGDSASVVVGRLDDSRRRPLGRLAWPIGEAGLDSVKDPLGIHVEATRAQLERMTLGQWHERCRKLIEGRHARVRHEHGDDPHATLERCFELHAHEVVGVVQRRAPVASRGCRPVLPDQGQHDAEDCTAAMISATKSSPPRRLSMSLKIAALPSRSRRRSYNQPAA